jgi:hypothetical protein
VHPVKQQVQARKAMQVPLVQLDLEDNLDQLVQLEAQLDRKAVVAYRVYKALLVRQDRQAQLARPVHWEVQQVQLEEHLLLQAHKDNKDYAVAQDQPGRLEVQQVPQV